MTFPYNGHEVEIPEVKCWYPLAVVYDPIKAGSIDGTDVEPHDKGVVRALNSNYKPSYKAIGNPINTIFIGRLSLDTTEDDLEREFSRYGKMIGVRLVRDIVTGLSKRYGFVEYETYKMARNAYMRCKSLVLNQSKVFVDFECGRLLPGWKPRRLGGGFGGEKQSGQLRFGGRNRNYKPPIGIMEPQKRKKNEENKKPVRSNASSYAPSTATAPSPRSSTAPSPGSSTASLPGPSTGPLPGPSTSTGPSTSPSTAPSTTASYSNPIYVSTTSSPSIISLPLTPPLNPSIVLPLTPPSHSTIQLPLTPPSNPIIVLPLTPPPQPIVTLPLTPPPSTTEPLPLTPPPNINPPNNFL